jgi:hypothetical protein
VRCTAFLGVIGRQTAGACRLHMSVLPMKTGDGTGNGAGNGDPQALFIAIAWLESVGENGPKADPQKYNYTKRGDTQEFIFAFISTNSSA